MPEKFLPETICLKDEDDTDFIPRKGVKGVLNVTELARKKSIGQVSSMRLTETVSIDLQEKIQIIGEISSECTQNLLKWWQELADGARVLGETRRTKSDRDKDPQKKEEEANKKHLEKIKLLRG